MAALNIKNERTYELTKRLAEITGESLTEAVTRSVEERLARVRRPDAEERYRRIMEIAKRSAPLFEEPWRSVDHGDLLYDGETGLPK
jgi:antitoxin VapB